MFRSWDEEGMGLNPWVQEVMAGHKEREAVHQRQKDCSRLKGTGILVTCEGKKTEE